MRRYESELNAEFLRHLPEYASELVRAKAEGLEELLSALHADGEGPLDLDVFMEGPGLYVIRLKLTYKEIRFGDFETEEVASFRELVRVMGFLRWKAPEPSSEVGTGWRELVDVEDYYKYVPEDPRDGKYITFLIKRVEMDRFPRIDVKMATNW